MKSNFSASLKSCMFLYKNVPFSPNFCKEISKKGLLLSIPVYGRPKSIELLVLVDRRFKREIPIEANYFGTKIDTFKGDKVKVVWDKKNINNKVFIES